MADVKIKIDGDPKDYIDALDKSGKATKSFADKFVFTYSDIKGVAKDVYEALKVPYEQFAEAERAVKELNQAMINAGTYSSKLQNNYLLLASELQKTTKFSDDQTISAIASIQAHIGSIEVTDKLVKATMNLATAKKIDLAQAAEMVGKTINSETNYLKKSNIEITNSSDVHTRFADVIDKINNKYGDYATKAGAGAGQTMILKNSLNDFLEALGEKFAPEVNAAAGVLAKLIQKGSEYISGNSLNIKSEEQWQESLQRQQIVLEKVRGKVEDLNRERDINLEKIKFALTFGAVSAETELKNEQEKYEKLLAAHKTFLEDKTKSEDAKTADKIEKAARAEETLLQNQIALKEASASLLGKRDEELAIAQIALAMKASDQYLAIETDKVKRVAILKNKSVLEEAKLKIEQQKAEEALLKQDLAKTAEMATSKNALIAGIGKAAAIRQIWIDAPKNAQAAYGAMVGIPIVGPALAMAAQIASYAFSAESAAKVLSAASGGLVTGGIAGRDSVPAMLMPGELVVPERNYEEVINAVTSVREGGGGQANIVITLKSGLMDFIEAQLVERESLRLSIQGG